MFITQDASPGCDYGRPGGDLHAYGCGSQPMVPRSPGHPVGRVEPASRRPHLVLADLVVM
jgi:hypothetical protein